MAKSRQSYFNLSLDTEEEPELIGETEILTRELVHIDQNISYEKELLLGYGFVEEVASQSDRL